MDYKEESMSEDKYPLNDLCERCHILDGITVQNGTLVCFRCQRKLKKENKKNGRKDERKRRIKQGASPTVSD